LDCSFSSVENFFTRNEVKVGRSKRNQNVTDKKEINNAGKNVKSECLEKWRLKCKLKWYLKAVENGEDDNK
jgi:hypothetical protein